MATGFTIPTRNAVAKDFTDQYAAAFPEKNTARGSEPWRLGRVISGVAWSIFAKFLFILKEALPDTAEGAYLQRWSQIYSFPYQGAAPSQGVQSLQVAGTPTTAIPTGSVLAHLDGTQYQITTVGAVVGAGGTATVDVAAISTGAATNKRAGDTLTFVAPPAGITPAATILMDFVGGLDNEIDDRFRPRFLAHLGDPPEGGAIHDYYEWALRVTGAASAYVYRHRRGVGTIDVAVLGPGTGAARLIANLVPFQTYIDGVRPAMAKDFTVLTVTLQTQDIQAHIKVDETKFPWDWDDTGLTTYVVTAVNAAAFQITVPTIPSSVVVGKRLTVRGEEAQVTAVGAGGVLTLAFGPDRFGNAVTWFSADPTGQSVRCSGPLVTPVRNAILALFDNLGPCRGNYATSIWNDGVRVVKVLAAISDVAGDIDADIALPVANILPVDPLNTTIPLLVPGFVQVWKQ